MKGGDKINQRSGNYRLRLTKEVSAIDWSDSSFRLTVHRSIKARRVAIRRRLLKRNVSGAERANLHSELEMLDGAETAFFGVRHRPTTLPLNKEGKRFVPKTARGKSHVPVIALPLNARGRRHVPSARDIVEAAVFSKAIDKGNLPVGLAKLAAINPAKYGAAVRAEARINPAVRRAINRVGSDISVGWPPSQIELLILENFYASQLLSRPLHGLVYDEAVKRLECKANVQIGPDRYRRIRRKFLLA